MIDPLSLFSEEYNPHGNVAAEGVLNQLERPGLDLLTLLVRETVQNSRDARLDENETVYFTITGRTLTTQQTAFLRETVLKSIPDKLNLRDLFSSTNLATGLQVLVISDRNTTGLNGPIRANIPDDASGSRNFVNFFFNTGQSKGKQLSGGTYGYGKSILYRISRVHTICVYTRCRVNGRLESRFMAVALDPHSDEKQATYQRHTGRYWWGRINNSDGILEPVIGQEADEIARELGFPDFTGNDQGTSCMVLSPVLGSVPLDRVMQGISRILLWYAWPAMIPRFGKQPTIQFSVFCEGQPIPIPDPSAYAPLHGFVQALQLSDEHPQDTQDYMWQVMAVASQKSKQLLGRLALLRFLWEEREEQDKLTEDDDVGITFPIVGSSRHVALMRNTDLVVKYLEGATLPGSRFEYAGVFVAERAIDAAFAKAEPPTHDDWKPQTMDDRRAKSYVNIALREIKKAVVDFTAPLPVTSMGGEVVPLGSFADQLASFMIGVKGFAAHISASQASPLKQTPQQPTVAAVPILDGNNSTGMLSNPVQSTPINGNANENAALLSSSTTPVELFGPDKKNWDEDDDSHTSPSKSFATEAPDDPKSGSSPLRLRRVAKIYLEDEGHLELLEDIPVLLTAFRVEHASGSLASNVEVQASVILDNGTEEEPPASEMQPEVLLWITSDGKERSGSDVVRIPATDPDVWKVAVSIPEDAKIQVSFTASEVF